MSFPPCFSRQGNIPSHHIFTHACSLPHYPLCPQGWDLSWPRSRSLVWVFHPLPAPVSPAEQPRHILESGTPRGKLLHLLHNAE